MGATPQTPHQQAADLPEGQEGQHLPRRQECW